MYYKTFLSVSIWLAVRLASATPIGTIQGAGATATPGTYTIEAVVTAVYPDLQSAGFYVQNDAATADKSAATSDALFVVQSSPTVAVGDRVRISGTVREDAAAPSFGQAVLLEPTITYELHNTRVEVNGIGDDRWRYGVLCGMLTLSF